MHLKKRDLALVATTSVLVTILAWTPAGAQQPATAPTQPEGERITTPSGLTIVKTAPGGGAIEGDVVLVLYTGRLTDGTVFDASVRHGNQPIPVKLGGGGIIKGWDEGLRGRLVGEKFHLIIPPALGYGQRGREIIPPNATLEFDMEVVGILRGVAAGG
jgi:FKBP-type peptidyl-prolyl cis-trans isomerase